MHFDGPQGLSAVRLDAPLLSEVTIVSRRLDILEVLSPLKRLSLSLCGDQADLMVYGLPRRLELLALHCPLVMARGVLSHLDGVGVLALKPLVDSTQTEISLPEGLEVTTLRWEGRYLPTETIKGTEVIHVF